MRFRPRMIDYHTEALLLLEDDRTEPRRIMIVAPPDHNKPEEENNNDAVEEPEDFKATSDRSKDTPSGSNDAKIMESVDGINKEVDILNRGDSSPDSSQVIGFDYGDEMSNYRRTTRATIGPESDSKSNDIIETKKRKEPSSSPPVSPKPCSALSSFSPPAQANQFDGHIEFQGKKRSMATLSSGPDTISNVTETKCPMQPSMIDATERKHPMQPSMKTSFYDTPWLLSLISNIRRVTNRKRLAMTPCESFICQRSASMSSSVSLGHLFPTESWIVGLSSCFSSTVASQRAGQQLDRLQNLLNIGTESPNPTLLQDKRCGRFTTQSLGTRPTRREALEREKLALVVYQGKGKEDGDIRPEELKRAWQACFAIAQNISVVEICTTPAAPILEQEACQQHHKKKRISPKDVHNISGRGNRSSSSEMEGEVTLKHPPVPRKESVESIVNEVHPARNSNIGDRTIRPKHTAPMSESERHLEDTSATYAPVKKKRRKQSSTIDPVRIVPQAEPAFMENDSKASARHEERIRKEEEARREEGYRKKEAALLKQFGLEVKSSSSPSERDTSDDPAGIGRFSKSEKVPRRNSIVVPEGERLRSSSRRISSINTPSSHIQTPFPSKELRSEPDQYQGGPPLRPLNSRPTADKVSLATRDRLNAAPLRCGTPDSFGGKLKREKPGSNGYCQVQPDSAAVFSQTCTPNFDVGCTDPYVSGTALSSSHVATPTSPGHELQRAQVKSNKDHRLHPLNSRSFVSKVTMARVMSKAPPLRGGTHSSFDKNLKRQKPRQQNTDSSHDQGFAKLHIGGESGSLVQPIDGNSEINRFPAPSHKHEMAMPSSIEVDLDKRIESFEDRAQMGPPFFASHGQPPASLGNSAMSQTAAAASSSRVIVQQHDAARASAQSEHETPANNTRRSLDRRARDATDVANLQNNCGPSRMTDAQSKNFEVSGTANTLSEVPDARNKEVPIQSLDGEIAQMKRDRTSAKELKRERKRKRKEERRERKERKRERKKLRAERKKQERTTHVQESAVVHGSQSTRVEEIRLKSGFDRPKPQSLAPMEPPQDMGSRNIHGESKPVADSAMANAALDYRNEIHAEPEPDPVTRLLCAEAFYETWGQLVAKLASGEWEFPVNGCGLGTVTDIGNEPKQPCQRIQFIDCDLLDVIGVDIELGSRAAFVVSAVSTWSKGTSFMPFIKRVIKLAEKSKYKCIEVFVCVDVEYNDEIASEIDRLENNFLRQYGCPASMITLRITSPNSLPHCLGRSVLATGFTYAEEVADLLSQVRVAERIRFLLSIVPSLSLGGALKSMEIFNSRSYENVDEQDVSNIWFGQILGKRDTERQRQQQLASTRKDVRDALNPEAMIQLSFIVNLALDPRRIPM